MLTQNLGAMAERISGVTEKIEPSSKSSSRKSCSREQIKPRSVSELYEDHTFQSPHRASAAQGSVGTLFTQTFPDTAVTFKPI